MTQKKQIKRTRCKKILIRNWMVLENAWRYGRGEKKKEKWNRNEIAFGWYYFTFGSADRSQVEHEFVLLEAKFTHLFKAPRLFHSLCSFACARVKSYGRFLCVLALLCGSVLSLSWDLTYVISLEGLWIGLGIGVVSQVSRWLPLNYCSAFAPGYLWCFWNSLDLFSSKFNSLMIVF